MISRGPDDIPPPREIMVCGKCRITQVKHPVCVSCGLRADLFTQYAQDHPLPATIEAAWRALVSHWADADAHQQLLANFSTPDQRIQLRYQYQSIMHLPEYASFADAQLQRLREMGMAQVAVQLNRPAPPQRNKLLPKILFVIALVIGAVLAAPLFRQMLLPDGAGVITKPAGASWKR